MCSRSTSLPDFSVSDALITFILHNDSRFSWLNDVLSIAFAFIHLFSETTLYWKFGDKRFTFFLCLVFCLMFVFPVIFILLS